MLHYRLRTLLMALGVVPPLLAGLWFAGASAWLILLTILAAFHIFWEWGILNGKSALARTLILVLMFWGLIGYLVFAG